MSFSLSDCKADSCHFSVHRRDFDDENNFSGNHKGEKIDGRLSNFTTSDFEKWRTKRDVFIDGNLNDLVLLNNYTSPLNP